MQTDLLYKQLTSSLADLKTAIDKFEKHTPPSSDYTEQLYKAMTESNKLLSAYSILKEHKDISPDLNLHLKLMSVPETKEVNEPIIKAKEEIVVEKAIEPLIDVKVAETKIETPIVEKPVETPIIQFHEKTEPVKAEQKQINFPNISVNINDKFRFINELFKGNGAEYNASVDAINTINNITDAKAFFETLKNEYAWKNDNELVIKLYSIIEKRFL